MKRKLQIRDVQMPLIEQALKLTPAERLEYALGMTEFVRYLRAANVRAARQRKRS